MVFKHKVEVAGTRHDPSLAGEPVLMSGLGRESSTTRRCFYVL